MDTEESQKSWISHYVGNGLVPAACLVGQGRSAEELRKGLVQKLQAVTSGKIVDEVIGIISRYDWSNIKGIEDFREEYLEFDAKYAKVK